MGELRKLRDDDSVEQADVPFSVDAEEGVIGACLLSERAADVAFEIVQPEDFFREPHRAMAGALVELRDTGTPIDMTTLSTALLERNELETVGGSSTIAEIIDRVPSGAHVEAYARTVRRLSHRRQLIATARALLSEMQTDGRPVDDYVPERLTDMVDIAVEASGLREKLGATITRVATEIEGKQAGEVEPAYPTGLRDLDRMIGGIRPGHLIVVGGLSSHGKTSVATQMIEKPLQNGIGVGIISADTAKEELLQRIAGQRLGVCTQDILDGALSADDLVQVHQALDELHDQPLEIVDEEYDWTRIKVAMRRMIGGGAKIIVVDHLTLLTNKPQKGRVDYWLEMAGITRDLQQITRQGVAVILLVQINVKADGRQKKSWRPTGGMLKGTGTVYENANEVLLGYWPGKDKPEEDIVEGCEPYEVRVDKQKMGATGVVRLRWDPKSMRLHDWFDEQPGFFGDGQ